MFLYVNRAPVLTLWAAVVAERLGYSRNTALTLGRAVGGSTARLKVRIIGREDWKGIVPDAPQPQKEVHRSTPPVFLLGKTIQLLPNVNGELRAALRTLPIAGFEAADEFLPVDLTGVLSYLARAFGDELANVRIAMEVLAARYEPRELNRIGFRLYEKFRPELPHGREGRGVKALLEVEKIGGANISARPSISSISRQPSQSRRRSRQEGSRQEPRVAVRH